MSDTDLLNYDSGFSRQADLIKHQAWIFFMTVTRRVANQDKRDSFSPSGMADPARNQPNIS